MKKLNKCLVLLLMYVSTCSASFSKVTLVDNAYTGVLIAINPEVPEDPELIDSIKTMIHDANDVLWVATHKMASFGEVTILVPKTWKSGNYGYPRGEVYDNADVIIAEASELYGETPYPLQYGLCGKPGVHIHLTPQYLKDKSFVNDFGPRGKVFVHEWAHLRWGVYDESPKEGDDSFYYDSNQEIQATRCPIGLTGERFVDENGEERPCKENPETGLPEDGCVFYPHYDQSVNASLMSHHFNDYVIQFCDDSLGDNGHNSEALNEHNTLCDRKSTWAVIKESPDFAGGANQPSPNLTPTVPVIKVVKAVEFTKFVLVLDTSGSMGSGVQSRLEEMQTAASLFLSQFLPNGTNVGIVEFSSSAYTLINLVLIDNNRDDLVNIISGLTSGGGTCIGCGIRNGIQVLEEDGKAAGGNLIVLSDGEEGGGYPTVADMADEVLAKEVFVDTIFFGGQNNILVNQNLQELCEDSGGDWFFNEDLDLISLMESFKNLANTRDGDVYNEVFQLYSNSFVLQSTFMKTHDINFLDTVNPTIAINNVYIDSTIGNNTVFTFTWSQGDPPYITLSEPNGAMYCSESSADCDIMADVDSNLRLMTFTIGGIAKVGSWQFQIYATQTYSQTVDVIVTSMASDRDVKPIVVESGMSEIDAKNLEPIVVYGKVSMGHTPVLGADVIATITLPNGTKTELELFDTGAAPDVRKDDGVYSRYFTTYFQTGRYAVQVKVTGIGNKTVISTQKHKKSSAAYNPGYINSNGTLHVNPKGPTLPGLNSGENGVSTSDLDPFTRVVSPGGFSYQGAVVDPSVDVLPPGKVIDLVAKQVDVTDLSRGVRLTFSAPGDDYDTGRAKVYQVRYSYDGTKQLSDYFESCILVTKDMLIEGDIHNPAEAGIEESLVVSMIKLPDQDTISIWFALRAYDGVYQSSPTSNIAMMNVFIEPYTTTVAATTPTTTTTEPTTTTAKTTTTTAKTTTEKTTTVQPEQPELEEQLRTFQIVTIVVSSFCIVLVIALIGTAVSYIRMTKQRRKSYRLSKKKDERLELGQTNVGSIVEPDVKEAAVSSESGNINQSFSE